MSKRTIVAFCLLSLVFIAAATMVYTDENNTDEKPNVNNNNYNDQQKENKDSDCKLEKKLDPIINENENREKEDEDEEEGEEEEDQEEGEESGEGEEIEEEDQEEGEEMKMFGVSINELMQFQEEMNEGEEDDENRDKIPFILEVMMNKVKELEGFQTEGIFRVNGNMKDVEDLATNGFDPYSEELNQYEVHTWASLLKKWIRELPEPLIPDIVYKQLIQILSPSSSSSPKSKASSKKSKKSKASSKKSSTTPFNDPSSIQSPIPLPTLSIILKTIQPTVFYDVLESLGLFFAELLQPENIKLTKIDIDSLTTIITPTIFKPKIEISQENLSTILATQSKEKLIFKSIIYYFTEEFKRKQEEEKDQEEEVEEGEENQEEQED